MARIDYVHGYEPREHERLEQQGEALADLLHGGLRYPSGSHLLEVGSGTGAQTMELLRRHPGVAITCVERDPVSLAAATQRLAKVPGSERVRLIQGDLRSLSLPRASFDHLFVCFVLEHVPEPDAVVRALLPLLRPGGSVTVIEGDHGTTCFHPESAAARAAIDCLVHLQRDAGGDALIGRRLHPLLGLAGVDQVRVEPRTVYVDGSRPDLAQSFTLGTFTAMVAGIRQRALDAGLSTPSDFDAGLAALRRTSEADGTFLYTFFRAQGVAAGKA